MVALGRYFTNRQNISNKTEELPFRLGHCSSEMPMLEFAVMFVCSASEFGVSWWHDAEVLSVLSI